MTVDAREELVALQRWMQAVITHPGGVIAAAGSFEVQSALETPDGIDGVIERSRALSAAERLEIYHRAYFARLLECLRDEYSVLAKALGEELFDAFALGYLEHHPPMSYTLGRLGERFPEFLAETRPETGSSVGEPALTGDWPEFLIDLARLERTINEVFDGPGVEEIPLLDPAQLTAIPPESWPATRLVCVPCLKLIAVRYPVNDAFTAIRNGEHPGIDEPCPGFIAVTRRNYRVLRWPLTDVQHALLAALQGGATIGEAIVRASELSTASSESLAGDLHRWFQMWMAAGFFCEVR